jgi:hypothetical protein
MAINMCRNHIRIGGIGHNVDGVMVIYRNNIKKHTGMCRCLFY